MKQKLLIYLLLIYSIDSYSQITIDTAVGNKIYQSIKSFIYNDEIDKAKQLLPNIEMIFKQSKTETDSLKWYDQLYKIGKVYQSKGYWTNGLPLFQKTLPLAQNLFGEHDIITGKVYFNMGHCFAEKRYSSHAIEAFEKAIFIFKKERGIQHHFVAITYNAIANVYTDELKYQKALAYYQKALSIYQSQNELVRKGVVFNNIGSLYEKMNNYGKAKKYFYQAIEIYKPLAKEEYENSYMYPYFNLAETFNKEKEYEKAYFYIKKVQGFQEKNKGYPIDLADTYSLLGNIYTNKNKLDSAQYFIRQALKLLHKNLDQKHPKLVENYTLLGNIYLKGNDLDSALNTFQQALASSMLSFSNFKNIFANPVPNKEIGTSDLLFALKQKATAFHKKYDQTNNMKWLKEALKTCLIADEFAQNMRIALSYPDQVKLLQRMTGVYQVGANISYILFELTHQDNYKERIFFFSEKKKATTLSNILTNVKAKKLSGLPASILQKEKDLAAELAFYNTEIQLAKSEENKNDSVIVANFDSLFYYSQEYDDLIEEIEENYPKYYKLKHDHKVISSRQLQSLLDGNAAIISYALDTHQIIITVLTDTSFRVFKQPLDTELFNLDKTAFSLHKLLQRRNLIQKRYKDRFIYNSHILYQYLIAPIAAHIKGQEKLIIIPEGTLNYLPFEVLIAHNHEREFQNMPYLVKDFEVSYHYSSTLYADYTERRSYKKGRAFLGVAPIFDKIPSADLVVNRQFGALLWSEREVDEIEMLYDNEQFMPHILKRKEANEANFKAILKKQNYRVIHISSHGFADTKTPELSWIAFCQPEEESNGFLYASEVYNLELKTNLVVLSSCESGLGVLANGEGMISTNRGFLYAGALNMLYSIWKINDKYTYELMLGFYTNMFDGMNYSAALRQTKLEMINRGRVSAIPTNWAGFLLLGQ